jgi:hypothetical protein
MAVPIITGYASYVTESTELQRRCNWNRRNYYGHGVRKDPRLQDSINTVISRLTKIIRSGITFVSRHLRWPKRDFP